MRLRPLFGAAAVVALGASLVIAPGVSAGSGVTHYVDDDGTAGTTGCGGTKVVSETIQGAVLAASPGDTILVCPGTYTEQVTITEIDHLTVRAVKDWKAVIRNPFTQTAGTSGGGPYIVGIYVANDISFSGFKVVNHAPTGCTGGGVEVGILFVAARDISIRSNRVVSTGETVGDCGLSAGILAGFPFDIGTSAAPAGILTEDLTTTGLIAYNTVRDAAFMSIGAMSTSTPTAGTSTGAATKVDIRNNSVRYYHLGTNPEACDVPLPVSASKQRAIRTQLRGMMPAGITPDCSGIGIYMGAGAPDQSGPGASGVISRNRVMSGPNATAIFIVGDQDPTPAQAFGILVIDQKHAAGAVTVRENIVRRNVFGIAAFDAKGVAVVDNAVRQSFIGITVADTEGGATVRGNRARDAQVGIWVADVPLFGSSEEWYVTEGVVVKRNDATGNGEYSCQDDTDGDGTLGTANTWTDNDAEPDSSDPSGICGLGIN